MVIQLTLAVVTPPALPRIPLVAYRHPVVFNFDTDGVEINRGMDYQETSRASTLAPYRRRALVAYRGQDPTKITLSGDLYLPDWRAAMSPEVRRRNNPPLYPLNVWQRNFNKVRLSNYPPFLDYPDGEYVIQSITRRGAPPFFGGAPLIYRWQVVLVGGEDEDAGAGAGAGAS